MKFRLRDKDGKEFHEAVMPVVKRPEIVTWGARAFLFEYQSGKDKEIAVYRETSLFQIAKFSR